MDKFDDDEPIVAIQDVSGERTIFPAGKTNATIINKKDAPLEATEFKVLLELTGEGTGKDRPGVDLVMILDVSKSMKGTKLAKMKIAVQFVIKKLSPIDRLSIVKFANKSNRCCPLRQITVNSLEEIEVLVNDLVVEGGTNIAAGLEMGLKVLNDRRLTGGRVVGIMLMSDGDQNAGTDAAKVLAGKVPVYTFGFGTNYDPTVLNKVAKNSNGGTFSDVPDVNKLSIAFSQCLAGLLTVVVQDLILTVTQVEDESKIEKVSAGNYPKTPDVASGSVTVSFGDLYDKEIRKVLVNLLLPAVKESMFFQVGGDILRVTYTYRSGQMLFDTPPIIASVTRKKNSAEPERDEILNEEKRLQTRDMIDEARVMADDNRLPDARDKINEAKNKLQDGVDKPNALIENLIADLLQILSLMSSPEKYRNEGRPYIIACLTAHDRQRFSSRGDGTSIRLFSTPRMDIYLVQASAFDDDQSKPPPPDIVDMKNEFPDNLIVRPGPLVEVLSYILMVAQFFESIFNGSNTPP